MELFKPAEKTFKKIFYLIFKILLRRKDKNFSIVDPRKIERIIFLRHDKLGDVIVSLPVFDSLRRDFPHLKLSILASPKNKMIIDKDPRFEKIYLYTKNIFKDLKILREIKKSNYDCVVDMMRDDSVTSVFITSYLAGKNPRIGIGKTRHEKYFEYNYGDSYASEEHLVDNNLKILDAFGIDSSRESGFAKPYLSDEDIKQANVFNQTIPENDFRIGYNLSAGAPIRIWPEDKTLTLLKKMTSEDSKNHIILFTLPHERYKAEGVKEHFKKNISIIPPNMNLYQVSAIIEKLDILITPDTSLVHIARAFEVDVVGLYSSHKKNLSLWYPYRQKEGAVIADSEHNIYDITVDQVFDTFLILKRNKKVAQWKN